jgi:hypothetical protein
MKKRKLLDKILAGSKNIRFAEATAMKDYHINIFYSDDDDGYIADIPDLRHCSTFGKTPDAALSEVLKQKNPGSNQLMQIKKPSLNLTIVR